MGKIVVIGLGPGDENLLTLEAVEHLKTEDRETHLRTVFHPTVSYLDKQGIAYESYDYMYEKQEDFADVYRGIAEDLVSVSKTKGLINYCVPGHPLIAEKTVDILIELEKSGEVELEIVQGLSFIEPVILTMQSDPVEGLKIIDGLDIKNQKVDINVDNLITQVYNRAKASELKLELAEVYGDEYEVDVIRAAGVKGQERVERLPLYEIDRLDWIDYLTSVYVPKVSSEQKELYDFNDFLSIMSDLRGENGCTWDIKQTHESLKRYVIEEAYELVEAIEEDDIDGIVEELGDILLQVVFHAQIGREEGYFNIWDVIGGISKKMVCRHPHVFGAGPSEKSWNELKAEEKSQQSHEERLKSVPKVLPSLLRSMKVQKRASDVGFDWDDIAGPKSKVEEELRELYDEMEKEDGDLEGEMGDLLFSIVNMCRFLNIEPERALYKATDKFITRFSSVEREVVKEGLKIEEASKEQLEMLWNSVKGR